MDDPNGKKVDENKAFNPLRDQKLTETFGESAEPVCRDCTVELHDLGKPFAPTAGQLGR